MDNPKPSEKSSPNPAWTSIHGDPGISRPTALSHNLQIVYNPDTGLYEGVPDKIRQALHDSGVTVEQVMRNPSLIPAGLSVDVDLVISPPGTMRISPPVNGKHHLSISFNQKTGKFEGIPDRVLEELEKAGLSPENLAEIMSGKDEDSYNKLCDLLYKMDAEEVFKDSIVHDVSTPTSATHHVSVKFNEKTGQFEGVPQEILNAIAKAGLTLEAILDNPEKAKDIFYQLPLEDVLKNAVVHEISAPVSATHHISVQSKDGQLVGIPQRCIDALKDHNINSIEDVKANLEKATDVLYGLPLEDVLNQVASPTAASLHLTGSDQPIKISPPTRTAHHVSIKHNKETGLFEGIPQVILDELEKAGYDKDEVLSNPAAFSEFFYKLDLFNVTGPGKNITVVPSHDIDKPSTLNRQRPTTPLEPDANIGRLLPRASSTLESPYNTHQLPNKRSIDAIPPSVHNHHIVKGEPKPKSIDEANVATKAPKPFTSTDPDTPSSSSDSSNTWVYIGGGVVIAGLIIAYFWKS